MRLGIGGPGMLFAGVMLIFTGPGAAFAGDGPQSIETPAEHCLAPEAHAGHGAHMVRDMLRRLAIYYLWHHRHLSRGDLSTVSS
jgi:hypothetical protein